MDTIKNFILKHFGTPKRLFTLGLLMTIPFLLLVWISFYDWGFVGKLDQVIGTEFYEERESLLNSVFIFITRLGDGWFIALLTVVISGYAGFYKKNKQIAWWYLITVSLGAGALNQIVKFIFQRERPSGFDPLIEQGGYSFPSGHAMGSMIAYGALLFLIIRTYSKWKVILPATIIIIPLIALIGISRIYLGVHFPSDVIGGYSLGLAVLAFSLGIYSLFLTKKEIRNPVDTKGQ
ncbi:phosphatase PAP2 family protein [Alkalibacterium kapii]|uniref:Phosphatase PAP2 family protein n=1 Tax=Alkalibacterium kapii TaxID=426704 RepID=A0A511AWE3_9LACT|nr:phosphatase PAP2 family protein [Alkalibacterium kapii]GEK91972.1 phosphatase PAP2 family protein [Alkalibacterium kapii]